MLVAVTKIVDAHKDSQVECKTLWEARSNMVMCMSIVVSLAVPVE